jgi:hypothetical protein
VKRILEEAGRGGDYVEVSLDSPYRYNPLHNDLDAYALAYGIASLLNNLFGRGKEPFWQQAYTNLGKFIILLHKVLYDYVTLFDVYECAINPDRLEEKIQEGEAALERESILISVTAFMDHRELESYPFEKDAQTGCMKAPLTSDVVEFLRGRRIDYEIQTEPDQASLNPAPLSNVTAAGSWPLASPVVQGQLPASVPFDMKLRT